VTSAAAPVLDHLALASRRAWDNLERYGRQFGGRWLGGPEGDDQAFYFCQVGFANGTTLEFLQPNGTPGSDFLERFLHRNGPGPHHLTFKVSDIEAVMADAVGAGYRVVNADLEDPDWKEAFLHPKESHGIVIQLAQEGDGEGWPDPAPLPPSDQGEGTTIDRVTHLVADLDAATELFVGVLGMDKGDIAADHPLGPQIELRSGPWILRLVSPVADGPRHWLGDRAGRLLQIEMTVAQPALIDGLVARNGTLELPPERNLGTRVLIANPD
jgi:catechol 2,3-dioxygenase-like lactoylglutathione lyase family enzyme